MVQSKYMLRHYEKKGIEQMNTTDKYVKELIDSRTAKHPVTSVAEDKLVDLLGCTKGKMSSQATEGEVKVIRKMLEELTKEYALLHLKINGLSEILLAIEDAQENYGKIEDEKARSLVAMYGAILGMNRRAGATGEEAVLHATALMCAFLTRKE